MGCHELLPPLLVAASRGYTGQPGSLEGVLERDGRAWKLELIKGVRYSYLSNYIARVYLRLVF